MKTSLVALAVLLTLSAAQLVSQAQTGGSPSAQASAAPGQYAIDNAHTSVTFKIQHLGIAWVHGRFNDVAGEFAVDEDGKMTEIQMTIQVASIDTKIDKRDEHLRSPDFFDAEKYPEMVFRSTSIEPTNNGLQVTGKVTLHGQTRPLAFELRGGRAAEYPEGTQRTGYTAAFTLKRSDFGMKTMLGPVGDRVHAEVSFEGIKQ
ncbi:YceI family protein [Roseimaritima sediminicola]|uniref:YceI family protein n=1 Tax=Roseimaritima sediminicola TaxID=2662066 RepID=UPI0012985542|nr:YceI family protein [Roseimaritima sediminicola]